VPVRLALVPRSFSTSTSVRRTISETVSGLTSTSLRITNLSCAWLLSQFRNVVSGKAILAGEPQQLGQASPGPVDPALDGADRTSKHLGCFLIG
jgi:hypothetical protein